MDVRGGVEKCYYQFLLPADFQADFALPAIPQRRLPVRLQALFPRGAESVHLQVQVAPMGRNWAVALVQAANSEQLKTGPCGDRRRLCNRRCAPSVAADDPVNLLCIDNFASLGTDKASVARDGQAMEAAQRGRGLATHDLSGPEMVGDLLGFRIDGQKGAIRISPQCFWRLVLALDFIAGHPLLTGAELLKGGILGSRIPDILIGKSGHFSWKDINGQIVFKILKKTVLNLSI